MIRIESEPWAAMVSHARSTYPNECVGAMLGSIDDDTKNVSVAIALPNSFDGSQAERYVLRPDDLAAASKEARQRNLDLIGIYHSHPDCDAYFSETDLKNSSPWFCSSYVVLSIQKGEFHHANCWLPNFEQTEAAKEELVY
jgi:proteasome lid subunit RPN8/RPN11